jgi:hypothetical protein
VYYVDPKQTLKTLVFRENIVDIACCHNSFIALTSMFVKIVTDNIDEGKVITWGRESYGELGRPVENNYDPIPRVVESLLNYKIVQISAQWARVMALTSKIKNITCADT